MNLTYMLSPTTPYIMHTQTSNILSENLIRNKNITVDFNMSILSLNLEILKKKNEIVKLIGNPKNAFEVYCINSPSNFLRVLGAVQSTRKGFFDTVLNSIKTEIVLITCWNIYSIPLIKHLLMNGKRVVIGGSFCNCYKSSFIRSLLSQLGVKDQLNNLLIVSGYVGVNTDLYKIINEWKDSHIPNHDSIDMWTATNDHIKNYLSILNRARGTSDTYLSVTFNNNCWYNKCKFCKLRNKPEPDFIEMIDSKSLYENITTNLKEYGSKNLLINDNYFLFNKKNKILLENIRKDGIKVYILSGIIKLNSKEYLENINKYVDEIGVGLESTTDFSLNYISKGYTWNIIKESADTMSKYLNRDKKVRYLYINDLVSRDINDILERYRNMVELKNILNKNGFQKIQFSPTPLQLFPDVGMIENTINLITKEEATPYVSGMWYVYNYLKNKFNVEINVPSKIMLPFERYDINGNLLKSDFEYIETDLMNKLKSI